MIMDVKRRCIKGLSTPPAMVIPNDLSPLFDFEKKQRKQVQNVYVRVDFNVKL